MILEWHDMIFSLQTDVWLGCNGTLPWHPLLILDLLVCDGNRDPLSSLFI